MSEMREKLMHFLNIGTTGTDKYVLIGDGVSSLTEEFNPESETKQYINQSNGTTNIKSYTPSISVEKEYIPEEDNINVLLGFFRGQITHQRRREWKRELFR